MSRLFVAANSDKILVPQSSWSSRLSFSAWVYLTSSPASGSGYAFLSSAGITGYTGYLFGYKNDSGTYKLNFLYTFFSPGGDVEYTYAVTLSLNTWYHIAWTLDGIGGTATVYVNGVAHMPVLTGSGPVNVAAFGQGRIGAWYSGGETWYMDGRLSEMFWLGDNGNPVLSADEVLSLYRGAYFVEMRPTWPTNHYEAAWALEGLFDPEPDWSGQGRHSTSISGTSGAANPPTAWYPPLIPSYPMALSSGSGTLDLSLSVLVEPTAAVSIVSAPSCPDYTGNASRPPDPETGT